MRNAIFQRGLGWLCGLGLVFLAACGPVKAPDTNLQKSPSDDREYRLVTLPNQLQVLLISDPETPKAAASLDVLVGHGDNPPGRGGLAHFLEHMLFLGTDKYPDPAEYANFIAEHGGSRNAYTSFEHTNYFFDVQAPHLAEALDRFAQFFIAPRFDADYVDREKNAVHAEYQMGLKSDARRGLNVLQEVMNPAHPYSQFAVGSLESLADREGSTVRNELLAFYDKHYSANAMRLVVLGAETLDELEALVTPMFSPVPNKSYLAGEISEPLFAPDTLPMLVKIKPQATLRQLQVNFPIADYREAYRAKPLSYLGNLVGHEGEGSLLSQLKAEGLVESLSAGSGIAWRGGAMFSVNVSLTARGVERYQRVVSLLFNYLDMLRREGPQAWLYEEQGQLADIGFRFLERAEPIRYVSALSSGMHYYAPQDVLRGPYIMSDFSNRMLNEALADLAPERAQIVLTDAGVATNKVSAYYQVPYSVEKVSADLVAGWQGGSIPASLHLPAANEFIPEDVSLVALAERQPAVPERVLEQGRKTLWFKQAEAFRVPKGALYVNFRSPQVGQSAQQNAAAVLYTALLKDAVNEFSYPALLAGLGFDIYKHAQGISLRVSGYSDKQLLLLERLLAVMKASEFSAERFDNIRQDMVRSLRNTVAKRPSSQVIDDLRESLLYSEWGEQALIAALEGMELADLERYAAAFWRDATAEAMLYGNYPRERVDQVVVLLDEVVPTGPAPALPPLRVLQVAADETLQYRVSIPHDDSVLAWYLQGAGTSWQDRAATALTGQLIKSEFFEQLRTEQQLGYVVSAFSWPQMDVPGLVMLVQSPVADANHVAGAMQAYLAAVPDQLDNEQFLRHRDALVTDIMRPDKNLWERAEFYWQAIAKKQWQFDGREQLAEAVAKLDLSQWLGYYERVFLERRHSLQVVAPGRWGEFPAGAERQVNSAQELKANHSNYEIH